jgi:hypothetical protein
MSRFGRKPSPLLTLPRPPTPYPEQSFITLDGRAVWHTTVEAPWSGRTASGYGARIPTSRAVFDGHRWRRVKVAVWSNSGSPYVGRDLRSGRSVGGFFVAGDPGYLAP